MLVIQCNIFRIRFFVAEQIYISMEKKYCVCLVGQKPTPGHLGRPQCPQARPSLSSPSSARQDQRSPKQEISKISEISKDLLKTPISRWSLICPKSPSLHPPEIFAPQRGDFLHKIGFLSLFSLTTMVVNPPLLYDSLFFFLFFYPR